MIKNLRSNNFDVLSIYESYRGLTDVEIIELSQNPPRIILTEDKDFGEWVFAHGIVSISVIFLRYSFLEQTKITQLLVDMLKEKDIELYGKFITITVNKIRYRTI
ncbi:MAG: DUF5615 family PIN-like protein [Leeuwenhoekiella sp.]